ncbi:amidase [Bosea sp. (in: a-proteobacteria)]|uniref:amidase n=1 Tax=Bosea sp. (in: a-proteobacteria) TaxID=1871050 RepID=UPI00122B306A|nr:amidase [Bosea sp. (in: a-proteobacteria)]TAJ26873.1 MAG: amidase [Bosea sp. (in: a-proteobacteria)]
MTSTLANLQAALMAGDVTAEALAETALSKALAPDGEGARVFTRIYAERAREMARASDTLRKAGIVRSPLEGVPVSIKDLFDVAGETTWAGSVALDDAPPAAASSPVVERLVAAGAVLVGRTNMTEFAFSGLGLNPHYGTPLNPFDRGTGRIPGGSSSGAAISVTDGMAAAAIGTDTGGSVRIPAALCGLTGFKPTARRVPRDGALPLSMSLDSVGPLAASVICCALVDSILAGEVPRVPEAASLKGLRLAVPTTLALDGLDDHVAAAFQAALSALSAAGALVEEIAVPEFMELAQINAKGGLAASEAWHWHRALIGRAGPRYDPRVLVRIRRGADISAADYLDIVAARAAWMAAVERRIAGFDALLMPTVPVIAPAIASLADEGAYGAANLLILRNPTLINFLDGCALSVPCHPAGTAPVGLMVAGAGGQDRRILSIGRAIEAALADR